MVRQVSRSRMSSSNRTAWFRNSVSPAATSSTLIATRSQPRNLLSIARLKMARDLRFGASSGVARHVWVAVEVLLPLACLYSKVLACGPSGARSLDLSCHAPQLQKPKSMSRLLRRWNWGDSQIAADLAPYRG
jgi:hypothetical protein